jgi:sugar lactone lactonase YvrE
MCVIAVVLAVANCVAAAEMEYPLAIAVASDGTAYVADRNLPGVWKIADGKHELFFQGSKKFRTPLNAPRCIAVDGRGRVLVGDSATRDVYRFDADGKPQPLTGGMIGIPMGIAVNSMGEIFVADLETSLVWKVPGDGDRPVKFAEVPAPRGIAFDASGGLWALSSGPNQLLRIDANGISEPIVKGRPFQFPHAIAFDKDQTAYVCDGYAKTIWKIDAGGKPAAWIKDAPLAGPTGIAWLGDELLIVDPQAKKVIKADLGGKILSP